MKWIPKKSTLSNSGSTTNTSTTSGTVNPRINGSLKYNKTKSFTDVSVTYNFVY